MLAIFFLLSFTVQETEGESEEAVWDIIFYSRYNRFQGAIYRGSQVR